MWSSYHPYIFFPPPLSTTSKEDINMKYSQVVHLLSNFNAHKIQPAAVSRGEIPQRQPTWRPHIFHLEICPQQEMKMLPQMFSSKFSDTLPDTVTIKDPVGNVIFMKVVRIGNHTYLQEGWNKLVPFYGLYGGGWVRMSYHSVGQFDIKITNVYDEEILYTTTHHAFTNGSLSRADDILKGHPVAKILQPSKFVFTTTKTLDFEEAIGSKLKLVKDFCDDALTKKDGPITIIDEFEKPWHCHLTRQIPDPLYCWVTEGWAEFCYAKSLTQGKWLKLGVLKSNSSVLYYIPV